MILPLFGFANAGVALSGMTMNDLLSPVPVSVALGCFWVNRRVSLACRWPSAQAGETTRKVLVTGLWCLGTVWDWFYHEPVYRQSGLYRQPSAR